MSLLPCSPPFVISSSSSVSLPLCMYLSRLRHASAFLFGLLDPSMGLLARAPGSLFIDVFVRNNFTSDTVRGP